MEDDDEFGDLYTDVLRPIPIPPPSSSPIISSSSFATPTSIPRREEQHAAAIPPSTSLSVNLSSSIPQPDAQIRSPYREVVDAEADWILGPAPIPEEQPTDWNEEEEGGTFSWKSKTSVSGSPYAAVKEEIVLRAADASGTTKESKENAIRVKDEEVDSHDAREGMVKLKVEDELGHFDSELAIPGLSAGPSGPGAFLCASVGGDDVSKSEDWDSDSGDDLQIVLNDDSLDRRGVHGGDRVGGDDDDEDGEDDLVIVADEGQLHHNQGLEEQDRGEESSQQLLDGEKKELSEAAKGSVGIGAAGGWTGYSGQGFHPQHHSQFKYVRPGALPGPGVTTNVVGTTGQVRPFPMGLAAGRGRGVQRGFHPGFGVPNWGNGTSARPFGSGLDFTLPSHKTIFEVDIDAFEEKPWRHAGVDISDFFNFDLDEDKWKEYCKQLEQLRLESTMQGRIRVYESGRSEQDYDPDLPPELAAATGVQDVSAENTHIGKVDGGQPDLLSQGRGTNWRPPLPTGRAIQVESGSGERFPTIDTRQPRYRDSDAIIEIVPQDSLGDLEQSGNETREDECIDEGKESTEYCASRGSDPFPQTQNGDGVTRKLHPGHTEVPEGDGPMSFPPQVSLPYPGGHSGRSYTDGPVSGAPPKRYQDANAEGSNDIMSSQSTEMDRNGNKQNPDDHDEANRTSETLDAVPIEKESSIGNRDSEHEDRLDLADSTEEREEIASDSRNSDDTPEDSSSSHHLKKQKLSSQIAQAPDLDSGDGGNSRTILVDNTTEKSVTGNECVKHSEIHEDDIMHDARPRTKLLADSRRQRDDYGRTPRHEMDRSRAAQKGKETLHQSHLHREFDSSSTHRSLEIDGPEKSKERGASGGVWHKRDGDVHGRKMKDRDFQPGPLHRNKPRVSERKGGSEDLHMRKPIEEGYWRSRHDREGGPRQREGDDLSVNRRENLDDSHAKRRKDEGQNRREKVTKELLHGHRAREDGNQNKKERVDDSDHRRKDNLVRVRDKIGDHQFSGNRDENRRHRDREDRQRSKQAQEDVRGHRERDEGENVVRDNRVLDSKLYDENGKAKDVPKEFNSDDSILKRKRDELTKRGRIETHPRNRGHQEAHAHESQFNSEMKNYRNGRPSSHSNHSLHASDRQHINRDKHRNSSRRGDRSEAKLNSLAAGNKKHEDTSAYKTEKANKNISSDESIKKLNGKKCVEMGQEVKTLSDDENQEELRRGRSKLERWTSHIERDCTSTSNHSMFSSLRNVEANEKNADVMQSSEPTKIEINKPTDPDNKDASVVQISDREECDRHLGTVEKLKKRSERFKLPMPVEDTMIGKKTENEVSVIQNESLADSEIKQERPARKRRWGSS